MICNPYLKYSTITWDVVNGGGCYMWEQKVYGKSLMFLSIFL